MMGLTLVGTYGSHRISTPLWILGIVECSRLKIKKLFKNGRTELKTRVSASMKAPLSIIDIFQALRGEETSLMQSNSILS